MFLSFCLVIEVELVVKVVVDCMSKEILRPNYFQLVGMSYMIGLVMDVMWSTQ